LVRPWMAAFLTLSIMRFLDKANPVFRFAENVFAGISLGYFAGIVLNQTLKPNLYTPLKSSFCLNWDLLIAGAIGVLLYFRYIPKVASTARFALATYIRSYVGVHMVR